jgi:hypothetical protein
MRKETNHESSFAQCATARQVNTNKHEIWEVLKQCCSIRCLQRTPASAVYGRCAEGSALYGAIGNDAGISLKPQLEEAEAKPALEPIARRPVPL